MAASEEVPFYGTIKNAYVADTLDALLLFQAAMDGRLIRPVNRRLGDKERDEWIQSGCIHVYSEIGTGIKRWTDGCNWSPSRILDNFLLYRQMNQPFNPGEKKRALKKDRGGPANSNAASSSQAPGVPLQPGQPGHRYPGFEGMDQQTYDANLRQIVGSLVDSYQFLPDGLIKKTISLKVNGEAWHLVAYYTVEDVVNSRLRRPSQCPEFANIQLCHDLMYPKGLRNNADWTQGHLVALPPQQHPEVLYQAVQHPWNPQTPGFVPGQGFLPGQMPLEGVHQESGPYQGNIPHSQQGPLPGHQQAMVPYQPSVVQQHETFPAMYGSQHLVPEEQKFHPGGPESAFGNNSIQAPTPYPQVHEEFFGQPHDGVRYDGLPAAMDDYNQQSPYSPASAEGLCSPMQYNQTMPFGHTMPPSAPAMQIGAQAPYAQAFFPATYHASAVDEGANTPFAIPYPHPAFGPGNQKDERMGEESEAGFSSLLNGSDGSAVGCFGAGHLGR